MSASTLLRTRRLWIVAAITAAVSGVILVAARIASADTWCDCVSLMGGCFWAGRDWYWLALGAVAPGTVTFGLATIASLLSRDTVWRSTLVLAVAVVTGAFVSELVPKPLC